MKDDLFPTMLEERICSDKTNILENVPSYFGLYSVSNTTLYCSFVGFVNKLFLEGRGSNQELVSQYLDHSPGSSCWLVRELTACWVGLSLGLIYENRPSSRRPYANVSVVITLHTTPPRNSLDCEKSLWWWWWCECSCIGIVPGDQVQDNADATDTFHIL